MPIPFSAKGKLSPEEAIGFRKYELRITYPMAARILVALITGGLGTWYAWVSYIEGLDMTVAYVGIVLCALVPFALVWLCSLITIGFCFRHSAALTLRSSVGAVCEMDRLRLHAKETPAC